MVEITPEEFEDAVSASLDAVPGPLMDLLDNVAFFVEEEPPPTSRTTCSASTRVSPSPSVTSAGVLALSPTGSSCSPARSAASARTASTSRRRSPSRSSTRSLTTSASTTTDSTTSAGADPTFCDSTSQRP